MRNRTGYPWGVNIYLIEYAINSLLRQKYKSFFITAILTTLIFLLTSLFFITNSIKYELQSTVDALPEIVVQKIKAGRHYDIDVNIVDEILEITGVNSAVARVWGYYYFQNAGVNFSLVGIDEFEEQYKTSLSRVAKNLDFNSASSMVVGVGVKKSMNESYYKEYFNFIKPDGTLKKMNLSGVFDGDTQLESNDMIVMSKNNVRDIFDIDESKATDIVVKVANVNEFQTVASKIKLLYPDSRVITKDDLKISYQNICPISQSCNLFSVIFGYMGILIIL